MTNADDARAAAEAAEAEAAEAEAVVAAARARTRAIRLRRDAEAAEAAKTEADEAANTEAAEIAEATDPPAEMPADDLDAPPAVEADVMVEPMVRDAPKGRRRLRPSAAVGRIAAATVVVIASLGLLGLSVAMFVNHRSMAAQQDHRAEFAAAARQGVVTLMSLDHTKAQQDVDNIIGITTGDFKKDFENQAADMVTVAQENKVVTQVTVNAVAVQQTTNDTATVLLAALSTVSNAASQKQEPRAWRLSVDVAREGDQIKLSKVEFVP